MILKLYSATGIAKYYDICQTIHISQRMWIKQNYKNEIVISIMEDSKLIRVKGYSEKGMLKIVAEDSKIEGEVIEPIPEEIPVKN